MLNVLVILKQLILNRMITYLAVGLGGALGAVSRFILTKILPFSIFAGFPFQILVVNILGCFVMGLTVELLAFLSLDDSELKTFLTTGFLGGFTTFSSFALDYGYLSDKNMNITALIYAGVTVVGSLAAFFIGVKLIRLIYI